MKRYLPFVIVALVALATIGSGAMLYRARRPHVLSIPENKTVSAKGDAGAPHIRGNPDAPVTLEEYGDFQCPPCGMFATFLGQLENEYDSRLRVVFRNFPLTMHEHAREAALAAEAAGLQGRFWEMHDVLYREQETWSKAPNVRELFESYAGWARGRNVPVGAGVNGRDARLWRIARLFPGFGQSVRQNRGDSRGLIRLGSLF